MRISDYKLKNNKTMDKDEIISKLYERLSESNAAIDRATTDLGEENLGFHEEHFYLDLVSNLAPNEELLMRIEDEAPYAHQGKRYMIFGEEAVGVLENEGIKALVQQIREGDISYEIHVHKLEHNVFDTLYAFEGWNTYSSLSKEEYNQIANI
jgi:hypothetical protein